MNIDLHIHTTASDGSWTPAEVVQRARDAGLGLLAVCDHDSVGSVPAAAVLARQAGLAFLPAAEVSSLFDGIGLHILAYGIDPGNEAFGRLLQENEQRLEWLDEEILRRLTDAGYPIDMAAYQAYSHEPSRGGWKVLNFLIDLGICCDAADFFDRLFVDPIRPPWPDFPHPAEVAAAVRQAGGLPVLAHPGASLRERGVSAETLAPLVACGIAGIECYSSYHDEATTRACLDFCHRHDLLITGGSDCHGSFGKRSLGVPPVRLRDARLGPLEGRILHPNGAGPWEEVDG